MSQAGKKTERDAALEAVVESQSGRLKAHISKQVQDKAEAEDILQDVFMEFLEAYDLGQAIETIGAWLIQVAQNKVFDRFRRRVTRDKNEPSVIARERRLESAVSRPDNEWARKWLREELADAIAMLPEAQRSVFVQHELEGKSFDAIAKETGISVNTLLSRKHKAVTFLRDHLREIYDAIE